MSVLVLAEVHDGHLLTDLLARTLLLWRRWVMRTFW
ncbi:hypothetical protein GGR01_003759 [Acetobacter oeni]|nr:hypothetical protein [Acetobacter oeni]